MLKAMTQAPLLSGGGASVNVTPSYVLVLQSGTYQFTATGGVPPYTWAVAPGTGGSINSSGLFTAGTTNGAAFVSATDSLGSVGLAEVYVTNQTTLALSPNFKPTAVRLGTSLQFTASGGTGPYTYSVPIGGGSVNGSGVYTPPGTTASSPYVAATDASGTQVLDQVGLVAYDNESVLLDGVTQYIDASGSGFNPGISTPFSFQAWVNWQIQRTICAKIQQSGGTAKGWGIFLTGSEGNFGQPSLYLVSDSNAGKLVAVITTATFAPNVWHHVVVTYNGSGAAAGTAIWVDGVNQALTVASDSLTTDFANTAGLTFGAGAGGYFPGNLAAISTYNNYVLSGSEISALYNGGIIPNIPTLSSYAHASNYWPLGLGDTAPNFSDLKAGGMATGINGPIIQLGAAPT